MKGEGERIKFDPAIYAQAHRLRPVGSEAANNVFPAAIPTGRSRWAWEGIFTVPISDPSI